jgi:hypothetical protein
MPTAQSLQEVATFAQRAEGMRAPTEAETTLIAEALDAGALVSARRWLEYFGGVSKSLPVQFEGCYAGLDYLDLKEHNPSALMAIEAAAAMRDFYLQRVMHGDLHALAQVVVAEAAGLSRAA